MPNMALDLQCWANYKEGKKKLQRKSAAYVRDDRVLKFTEDTDYSKISFRYLLVNSKNVKLRVLYVLVKLKGAPRT